MNRRTWFRKTAGAAGGVILAPHVSIELLLEPVAMPTGALLTVPSLQRGVIQVIRERGAKPLLDSLPFKKFEGGARFNFLECEVCGFVCSCPIDESNYR